MKLHLLVYLWEEQSNFVRHSLEQMGTIRVAANKFKQNGLAHATFFSLIFMCF